MKLQFSLARLLVCVTVLAVVGAFSVRCRVVAESIDMRLPASTYSLDVSKSSITFLRPPASAEVALRFVYWGIPAVACTLGGLWAIRRLKSRRHNEPPVG
jgi:hypothetical protein